MFCKLVKSPPSFIVDHTGGIVEQKTNRHIKALQGFDQKRLSLYSGFDHQDTTASFMCQVPSNSPPSARGIDYRGCPVYEAIHVL